MDENQQGDEEYTVEDFVHDVPNVCVDKMVTLK
jgi:hypothetical protein